MPELVSAGFAHGKTGALNVFKAAKALRSSVLQAEAAMMEPYLVYPTFQSEHPEAAEIIRRAGGPKRVSQDLPHIFTWEGSGNALSVPGRAQSRELLRAFRPPVDLTEAFRAAGGAVVPDMAAFDLAFGPRNRPAAVGIDTEGNHLVPPILVQVCAVGPGEARVFLDQPRSGSSGDGSRGGGSSAGAEAGGLPPALSPALSPALVALLADPTVAKVFFDASGDVASLGVPVHGAVDVQQLVMAEASNTDTGAWAGGVKGRPSLADLAALCAGVTGSHQSGGLVRKNKSLQKRFGFMVQRPARRLDPALEWYAAADAWATAVVYATFKGHEAASDTAASDTAVSDSVACKPVGPKAEHG
jgi:hypothetical protein